MKYLLIFTLLLSLSACNTNTDTSENDVTTVQEPMLEEPAVEETSDEEPEEESRETKTFSTDDGLSFEYPAELIVSGLEGNSNFIYIEEGDMSMFEGGGLGVFNTIKILDSSLEEYLAEYKENEDFEQSTETYNDREYTYIKYYAAFGGYIAENYLIENEGKLYVINIGNSSDADELLKNRLVIELILETLSF